MVSDDPRISDDSTDGKNNRVWASEDALDQDEFHNVMISEFSSLSLWVLKDVQAERTLKFCLEFFQQPDARSEAKIQQEVR